MSQTIKGSLGEAVVNIFIGFSLNWCLNMAVLPMFGFVTLTGEKAFGIGLVFTGVSLFRQYVLRRLFNKIAWGNKS